MTQAQPGWYPTQAGQQYWDGQQWAPTLAPQRPETITVTGPNHALHALATLFTCGLWLPVWLIIAVLDSKKVRVTR